MRRRRPQPLGAIGPFCSYFQIAAFAEAHRLRYEVVDAVCERVERVLQPGVPRRSVKVERSLPSLELC